VAVLNLAFVACRPLITIILLKLGEGCTGSWRAFWCMLGVVFEPAFVLVWLLVKMGWKVEEEFRKLRGFFGWRWFSGAPAPEARLELGAAPPAGASKFCSIQ